MDDGGTGCRARRSTPCEPPAQNDTKGVLGMGLTHRVVALLALLAVVPSAHAKKCTDTSGFAAVMESVEAAVPCASATKHGKYVKQAKKAIGSALAGACKKQFVKSFIAQSTCGRPGFVLCCATNKKGKNISKVVKAGK